jgi:hypothetical protein
MFWGAPKRCDNYGGGDNPSFYALHVMRFERGKGTASVDPHHDAIAADTIA